MMVLMVLRGGTLLKTELAVMTKISNCKHPDPIKVSDYSTMKRCLYLTQSISITLISLKKLNNIQ